MNVALAWNGNTMDKTFLRDDIESAVPTPGTIRTGAVEPMSLVSGPGRRGVLWVTGCRRRCPGCIKPEYLAFSVGAERTVRDLAEYFTSIPDIQGVTFSGGEPFEQAEGLRELALRLRKSGLGVGSYSGYSIEAIRSSRPMSALLETLDFLIDGEYRQGDGPFQWMGSSNQRFHDLVDGTSRLTRRCREVQVSVEDQGVTLVGFPDSEFEIELERRLLQRGVVLRRGAT